MLKNPSNSESQNSHIFYSKSIKINAQTILMFVALHFLHDGKNATHLLMNKIVLIELLLCPGYAHGKLGFRGFILFLAFLRLLIAWLYFSRLVGSLCIAFL